MAATKRVLVLGAGLVARPLVHYLSDKGYNVVVGSRTLATVEKLIQGAKNAEAAQIDVTSDEDLKKLEEIVPKFDALISMLPYLFHPKVAALAIKYNKHFLTTSYVSAAMREMEPQIKEKGLVFINECGVDPGTDHMSAMRVIDAAKKEGGKVTSFTSYCGGLPAPDNNNNPFGYKLSWAPRGVLLASRNDATFLRDGKDVFIPGKDLFDNFETHHIEGLGELEAYPNRDSKAYINVYNLPDIQTMIRGTYRNKGWCPTLKKMADLDLLSVEESDKLAGKTYGDLFAELEGKDDLRTAISKKLNIPADSYIIKNLDWLGLLDKNTKIPEGIKTRLDAVCSLVLQKLQYAPGEKDMLVMQHKFVIEFPDKTEYRSTTLIDYGIANGDTSMSRTVSYPVAIAADLVLSGKFTKPGLSIPIIPELYNPILDTLETLGIKFVDRLDKTVPKSKPQ